MPKLPKLPKLFQVLSKYYKLTLELRLPDEYHELNSEIETNTTNWTLKLGLPDEYYELDSGIRLPDKYHKSDSGIEVARLLVTGRICTYVTKC
ncbi:hypothetical protein RCL_jg2990.t1 [Rhizophagus clarus]|uniref:Uncharacterized protein n=1 Tax=Rhizophagus clarus TaxID=94130 RepID=A0A8H3M7A0_9GLOM|nr:hypothetical protein RCL_jg2990.t1 [Rhizophagus clarus]